MTFSETAISCFPRQLVPSVSTKESQWGQASSGRLEHGGWKGLRPASTCEPGWEGNRESRAPCFLRILQPCHVVTPVCPRVRVCVCACVRACVRVCVCRTEIKVRWLKAVYDWDPPWRLDLLTGQIAAAGGVSCISSGLHSHSTTVRSGTYTWHVTLALLCSTKMFSQVLIWVFLYEHQIYLYEKYASKICVSLLRFHVDISHNKLLCYCETITYSCYCYWYNRMYCYWN